MVMQASLGPGAGPQLAGAVSAAGGLGTLGAAWTEPGALREQIRAVRRVTDRPFCVNLVLAFDQRERVEVCAEEVVPWVSLSWGADVTLVRRLRDAGCRVMVQAGSVARAKAAAQAGAHALMAQGIEAGGHVEGRTGLLALVRELRRAVSLPLVAAGGIVDPVGARAALTAGADAVAMGTRFVACEEALVHPDYAGRVVAAEDDDTVLTGLFDVGWPAAPHRVLRNSTYEAWEAAGQPSAGERPGEGQTVAQDPALGPIPRYAALLPLAETTGDLEAMALYAGQGAGLIEAVVPAGDILERFTLELTPA
jgi:nitronate monooxygenase